MSPSKPRQRTTIAVTWAGLPGWLPLSVGLVRVDGRRAGFLAGGKTRLIALAPGRRSVAVKLGNAWSPPLVLDLAPGEHVDLACGWGTATPEPGRPTGVGRIALGAALLVLGGALLAFPAFYLASPLVRDLTFRVVWAIPVLDRIVVRFQEYLPGILAIPLVCLASAPLLIGFGARLYIRRNLSAWLIRRAEGAAEVSELRSPLDPTPGDPPPGPITNQSVLAAQRARRATAGLRRDDDDEDDDQAGPDAPPQSPGPGPESTPGDRPPAG